MKFYCTTFWWDVCCTGNYLFFFVNGWSGLKEYIGANPALKLESATTVVQSKISHVSVSSGDYDDAEVQDQFYDAIAADSSSSSEDEESDNDEHDNKVFHFLPLLHQQ